MTGTADPDRDDRGYLMTQQYRDGRNLDARIALHERFGEQPEPWHPWLLARARRALPRATARVLDLGCGTGRLWSATSWRVPSAWRITLADLSAGMLAEARAAAEAAGVRIERAAQADAANLPFADGAFDLVLANHMLYHVPNGDRPRAVAEIRRVLSPGGALVAATNGRAHMDELIALVRTTSGREDVGSTLSGDSFLLETARDQLASSFPNVAIERYPSTLVVDEVEPLVSYALSVGTWAEALAGREDRLREAVAAQIAANGAVRITKDSGVAVGT